MFKDFYLEFEKLNDNVILPQRAYPGDAGIDIYTPDKIYIQPGRDVLINTGLKCRFPSGYVMELRNKSGLSVKCKIVVGAGVIDSGYRGEIVVQLYNLGEKVIVIEKGKGICQAVFYPVWVGQPIQVDNIEDDSERGVAGFGSTNAKVEI